MSTPNANAKVAIEIYVDDKGSVRIREFAGNTKNALDDIDQKNQGITGRIKAGWASVKGAWVEVMGVLMALAEAWNPLNTAADQYLASFQTQSRTLVTEFNELQFTISEQLDQIALKAQALDGFNLRLSASFDGAPVIAGIDVLIDKLHQLQQASAAARSASSSTSGSLDSEGSLPTGDINAAGPTINNNYNFNTKMSRSDVNNVIDEQRRRESRS